MNVGTMHAPLSYALALMESKPSHKATTIEETLKQAQKYARTKQMHSASSYCSLCRKCTWLADPELLQENLDKALVDWFMIKQKNESLHDVCMHMLCHNSKNQGRSRVL